jgi:hypothetical protein
VWFDQQSADTVVSSGGAGLGFQDDFSFLMNPSAEHKPSKQRVAGKCLRSDRIAKMFWRAERRDEMLLPFGRTGPSA